MLARLAVGFTVLPFWASGPLDPGNLRAGSPAQWPIAPQRMHFDRFFKSASFARRCSIVRWERTNLPLPGLPLWPNLPLPLALPKAAWAASCSWIASPACSSSTSSTSNKQFNAIASYSSMNIIEVVTVILTSCLKFIFISTKKTNVRFIPIPSLSTMPKFIPMLLINALPIGVGGVSSTWIRTLSRRRYVLPLSVAFSNRPSRQRRCRCTSCPGSWSFTKMYLSILFDKYLGDTFKVLGSSTCSGYQSFLSWQARQFKHQFHPKWVGQLHRRV